jgi:diguanylate cyclase (GGDEF)-like protein/PAS domain S-box-containing protein
MNVGRKLILIVATSVALVTIPSTGVIYYFAKHEMLANESATLVAETKTIVASNTHDLMKAEISLKSLSRLIRINLVKPPQIGEVAAFDQLIERNADGAWRSQRDKFDGNSEAGLFFPPDASFDIDQKLLHLRSKHIMDDIAGSINEPFSNIWLLTPSKTEIIYDHGVTDFVMQMAAETDYTKTPWMTLGDPTTNPERGMRWTPPLFDPVPKSWMVSAVLPVDVKGHWVGNIGHDIYLKNVFPSLYQQDQHYSGVQHFLLDAQGNFIQAGPWQLALEANPEKFKPGLTKEPSLSKLFSTKLTLQPHAFEQEVSLQGHKYLAIGMIVPYVNWQYFRLVPIDEILAPLHKSFYVLITMVLTLGFLIGFLINFVIKRNIVDRLQMLVNTVHNYGLGNFSARSGLAGDDEIAKTSQEFDVMADRLKLTLEELKESEFRWKFAIESSGDCLWDTNEIDQTIIFSKAWKEIIGYSEVDLINKLEEWESRIHPDDKLGTLARVQECLEGKVTVYVSEYRALCNDGCYKWVLDRGVLVSRSEDGTPLRMIGTSSDITARKLAENDLRIAATAFESQEGMLVTDSNSIILRVNRAFTKITGYTAEEAVGQTPRLLSSMQHDEAFYAVMWDSINNTGVWEGEIWNRRKDGEVYPEYLTITAVKGVTGTITNYVATLTDITERKQAADKIEHLAFYDSLTRAPNRRLLVERLKYAIASSARNNRVGALLFLDLDHFKMLNDTLGHDVGDLLLQQVAERLMSCVREDDTVARIGGDEFVVLLEGLSESALEAAAQAEAIGEKILSILNYSFQLATHEYHITPSIGVTLFSDHNQSQEELLKHADIAMYQAKKAGRNTMRFFDPNMQDAINIRAEMERELRKALEDKQFQLYYQVQVDHSGQSLGAEALIRWIHPERGLVSPLQFIPLAEETGLIIPIGQWVLDTACAQLQVWQKNEVTHNLTLSVNVSAKQFCQTDFVKHVQSAFQRYAIEPRRLKLELTESLLLENTGDIIVSMIALESIGVQFSLDDFGTGYSSLQYLKMLPLNQLKIDQSFVRDIVKDSSDRSIVRTIIAMAQSLGFEVIAEGVETEEQRKLLLNKGCKCFQGYLFGRPVPIDEFEEKLTKR